MNSPKNLEGSDNVSIPGAPGRYISLRNRAFHALKWFVFFLILLLFYLFIVEVIPSFGTWIGAQMSGYKQHRADSGSIGNYQRQIGSLEKELQLLLKRYNALTPSTPYLIVNTTDNRFRLYRNREVIAEGDCSTGSYIQLKTHDNKEWIFKTPKGRRTVQTKITSPVWRRPDWAFIEEGLPVPPPDHPSRYEAGVLGDYALTLGDGYMIHGTLYKRFLGMPVTHGCIRMNDHDLELVFKSLQVGSRVYIY